MKVFFTALSYGCIIFLCTVWSPVFAQEETDTTPPEISIPGDILASATSADGAAVSFEVSAWDETDGEIGSALICVAPTGAVISGGLFPVGTTMVTCSVADAAGNESSAAFSVTVDVWATLSGITVEQQSALADDTFEHGWRWAFFFTLPSSETHVQMRFGEYASTSGQIIPVADNLRWYSPQSSSVANADAAVVVSVADSYTDTIVLDGDADAEAVGRQVIIMVEMKIPVGSAGGSYSMTFGMRSDAPPAGPPGPPPGGFGPF